ncbi:MAG: Tm-1-like ATP-binding domain-containing protein [Candidatus Omnitrophica bacterium]|nr:Tm-1-like ATP-binding domain-containing protein [Candidatus Omnitrophota bacterium]
MKPIALIGTLDTKGPEIRYVQGVIESQGCSVLLIDTGTLSSAEEAAITAKEIADAAGTTIEALREEGDRGKSVSAMCEGIAKIVRGLHDEGKISGVLSLGGSAGTSIGTAAMRALPVGVPKVQVSTLASGNTSPYVGTKDVTLMYSVVDVAGLNRISREIFRNAAGAICGMVKARETAEAIQDKPIVAATMFGVTTPCVTRAREVLEEAGYEVLVFHATGSGGRAMEDLIRDGLIDGVLDVTTTEWCDELVGGVLTAGPTRLEAAAELGIPQVVSVGALDMVNFGPRELVPEKFEGRNFYIHNPTVTLMRTTQEEMKELGEIIAKKVSNTKGPAAFFIPKQGVSAIDKEGGPFHDTNADEACFESIRSNLGSNVELQDLDQHINDEAFAEAMAKKLIALMKTR